MARIDLIHLSYTLTFLTPFHFGTGLRKGLLDRTVVRDSGDYLYVPGSTLKGRVREYCEWLARLYERKDSDLCTHIIDLYDEKKALRGLGQNNSMVTRIFGSQQQPGHLFFDDAHQSAEEKVLFERAEDPANKASKDIYKSTQTDIYTQVRLDRPTHTSVPGALFTSEFGIRNFTFQGNIEGWLECTPIKSIPEGPTYSLLLLLAGLLMIDSIGGNKSTGKGRCSLTITNFSVNANHKGQHQWQSWFDSLGALNDYARAIQEEGQA